MHPVPARAAPLLEFITGDPIRVFDRHRSEYTISPRAVVVGMQTRGQIQLELQGSIECFVILFQPTGFHQLFATPMHELTDRNFEARAVLGAAVSDLETKLNDCVSFEQQVGVADEFLTRRLANTRDRDGISTAALAILHRAGRLSISALAEQTGYSTRHFERCFQQRLGMSPKLFARIARFEAALDHRAARRECLGPKWLMRWATTIRCTWSTISESSPAGRRRRLSFSWKLSSWSRSRQCDRVRLLPQTLLAIHAWFSD